MSVFLILLAPSHAVGTISPFSLPWKQPSVTSRPFLPRFSTTCRPALVFPVCVRLLKVNVDARLVPGFCEAVLPAHRRT